MDRTVFLSLGSNLGDRRAYLERAVRWIERWIGPVQKSSSVYESAAWGFESEDRFLNQVIKISTRLSPHEILDKINEIESACSRIRSKTERYISRTLDIDILYYDDIIIQTGDLIIPHPRMEFRRFVLQPLAEADPDFVHPVLLKSSRKLLDECADDLEVKLYTP